MVRAAIWRAKALRYAPPEMIARTKAAIRDDVNRLILRLQAALELDDPSPQPWHDTLRALVYSAADGFWTAEGRLLYDLQKVCIDHEREIYSANLLGWLWSYVVLVFAWMRNRFGVRENATDAGSGTKLRRSSVRCRISATCSNRSTCAPPSGD